MTEHRDTPQAHGIHIDASPLGATITIDGTPLPPGLVIGYELQHDVENSFPMLVLHTRQRHSTAFDGVARVAVAEAPDAGRAVADFVSQLDPAAVQRAALDREDLSGSKTEITEAILKLIAEWAMGGRDART